MRSGAGVGDSPDGVAGVVGYVEGAVCADADGGGASPDGAVGVGEAGHEVFVGAGGDSVRDADAEELVAATDSFVPRAV